MPMGNPVQVEIMGQTFSVTSEDGEDHVRRVAGYVDDKMKEVTAGGRVASSYAAAVLAALNIASEYQKLREESLEVDATIDRLAARLGSLPGGREGD
jgi:cell division protein ZapA